MTKGAQTILNHMYRSGAIGLDDALAMKGVGPKTIETLRKKGAVLVEDGYLREGPRFMEAAMSFIGKR